MTMATDAPDLREVLPRLERLEKQNRRIKRACLVGLVLLAFVLVVGQTTETGSVVLSQQDSQNKMSGMDKVYKDESHCLTSADMRGDKDSSISCYCRDAISDARYVYYTYVDSGKDRNLTGVVLTLVGHIRDICGGGDEKYNGWEPVLEANWKWNGPEVVRTYPPDEVIKRIKPSGGGRWVPFTVQLVYRDAQGHVARTDEYSSREFIPVFP